jgi:hypothetical protein
MSSLTVTAKGRVTLRKAILKHLGVKPGVCAGGALRVVPRGGEK